jgi:hypothetical protein
MLIGCAALMDRNVVETGIVILLIPRQAYPVKGQEL